MQIPHRGSRLTLAAIAYGGVILLWLSAEDQALWPVITLGAGLAVVVVTLSTVNRLGGRVYPRRQIALALAGLGAAVGALTAPLAGLLMLIKNAMHSHIYPDYPLPALLETLARLPGWTVAGLLFGVGLGLLVMALRLSPIEQEQG